MRVLAICSYPVDAAATRFRLMQFVGPLAERGIELDVRAFLDGDQFRELYSGGGLFSKAWQLVPPLFKRFRDVAQSRDYDIVLIQREAMPFGPAIFEWLMSQVGRLPMVLDLDDATYVRYVSPSYGKLGSSLKFFGKTDNLIRRADAVICGNRYIAEYAAALKARTVVIPTVVDTEIFRPRITPRSTSELTVGWIGTYSTYPFLESVFPVLERLAESHRFTLKIVGAGRAETSVGGVRTELNEWRLNREVADFQSLDIGLYPIVTSSSANDEWIRGKSGFKAIQYLAVGVPFVMTPAGVCAEIGVHGRTHFCASTQDDWYNALHTLMENEELRLEMSEAGRDYALKHYGLDKQADLMAETLRTAAGTR